eukprot:CAMPEP_0171074036 /NCGR_PEP_ID=MMETSP0766_2-20121228/11888_1 /TAXON_ID=439317 /ORGANISM="Gambierdiscus australes, Strain CAWD 149" /LENGTH=51 /DNA_ID=CAMNT_0011530783 /DNA_START=126 /DNA_END=278 /DNA_ORIENTATION=-
MQDISCPKASRGCTSGFDCNSNAHALAKSEFLWELPPHMPALHAPAQQQHK